MEQMEDAERTITASLPTMNDIRDIQDQRDKLSAVEQYLKGKEAHLPARGAQRRLEARIGQLRPSEQGRRTDKLPNHDVEVEWHGKDMADFRVLARALNGSCELSKDEWRQSRRGLVALVKSRTKKEAT